MPDFAPPPVDSYVEGTGFTPPSPEDFTPPSPDSLVQTSATEAAVADPGFIKGLDLASVPLDAAKMLGQFALGPLPGAYHALHQAYDVLTGVPVEKAIPESQTLKHLEDIKTQYGGNSPEYRQAAGQAAQEILPNVALLGLGAKAGAGEAIQGGEINASKITSPESVPVPEVRQGVGGEAPLHKQGQAAPARTEAVPQEAVAPAPAGGTEPLDVHALTTMGGGQQVRVAVDKNGMIVGGVGEIGYRKPDSTSLFGEELIGQNIKDVEKTYPGFQQQKYTIQPSEAETWKPESALKRQAQPEQPVQGGGETSTAPEIAPGANVAGFEQVYGGGEIRPGGSLTPEDAWNQAQADRANPNLDPYRLVGKVQSGGMLQPREMGELIAEHDRLLHEAAAQEGQPGYDQAYQAAKDFAQNMVKPAENAWHQMGVTMQIKAPIDYTNLTGFREAVSQRLGREMRPEEAPTFEKAASDVRQADAAARDATQRTTARIRQHFERVKDMSFEDAAKDIHDSIANLVKECNL